MQCLRRAAPLWNKSPCTMDVPGFACTELQPWSLLCRERDGVNRSMRTGPLSDRYRWPIPQIAVEYWSSPLFVSFGVLGLQENYSLPTARPQRVPPKGHTWFMEDIARALFIQHQGCPQRQNEKPQSPCHYCAVQEHLETAANNCRLVI